MYNIIRHFSNPWARRLVALLCLMAFPILVPLTVLVAFFGILVEVGPRKFVGEFCAAMREFITDIVPSTAVDFFRVVITGDAP